VGYFTVDTGYGIRLVDGETENEGRLEVQMDGVWGTVCHYMWSFSDADVACRQLGFSKAVVPDSSPSIPGLGLPIFFYTVDCNGSEEFIWDCPSSGYGGKHICSHGDDVRLLCFPNGMMRLC